LIESAAENYCISHNSRAVVHQWVGAARLGFFHILTLCLFLRRNQREWNAV